MAELRPGDIIGGRTVRRLIGRGGMGSVYEVEHGARREALKLLTDFEDPESLERFLREADAMARVSHAPQIITIYSVDAHATPPWIAMEYIEGRPLEQQIPAGGLPAEAIARLLRGVLTGLATIHEAGILHRDLKSTNILIRDSDGEPVILDFGLARSRDFASLTATGALVGTPATMAPEQIEGREATTATDLWACGVLIYEMLAGHRPFAGPTLVTLLNDILKITPESPTVRRLDRKTPAIQSLERLAQRLLEKDPARRPSDAREVLAALDRELQPEREGRRLNRALILLLPVLVVGLLAVALRERSFRSRPKVGASAALQALLKKHDSFVTARGRQVLALGPRGRRLAALPAATPVMPHHALFATTLDRDSGHRSAPQLAFRLAADRIVITASRPEVEPPPAVAAERAAARGPLCQALTALAAGELPEAQQCVDRARAEAAGQAWQREVIALLDAVLAFERRDEPATGDLIQLPDSLSRDLSLRGLADRAAADLLAHRDMNEAVRDAWDQRRSDGVWSAAFTDSFSTGVAAQRPAQRELTWRHLDKDGEAIHRLRRLVPEALRQLGRGALSGTIKRARVRERETRDRGPSALLDAWREAGALALHLAEWDPAPRLPPEFPTTLFASNRFDSATSKHETPTAVEVFEMIGRELFIARTGFFHGYVSNDVPETIVDAVRRRLRQDPRFPPDDPVVVYMEARLTNLARRDSVRTPEEVEAETALSIRQLRSCCEDPRLGESVRLEALSLLARLLESSGHVRERLEALRASPTWPIYARIAEEAGTSIHPEPGRKARDWLRMLLTAGVGDPHARRVAAAWRTGLKTQFNGDPRYFRNPTGEKDRYWTFAWCALARVELLAGDRPAALRALDEAEAIRSRRVESITELLKTALACDDKDRLRRLLEWTPIDRSPDDREKTAVDSQLLQLIDEARRVLESAR